MLFVLGRVVQWREVLRGQVWDEYPLTVVDDSGGVLAVLLEPGSAFVFAEHPFGTPDRWWRPSDTWQPGDAAPRLRAAAAGQLGSVSTHLSRWLWT